MWRRPITIRRMCHRPFRISMDRPLKLPRTSPCTSYLLLFACFIHPSTYSTGTHHPAPSTQHLELLDDASVAQHFAVLTHQVAVYACLHLPLPLGPRPHYGGHLHYRHLGVDICHDAPKLVGDPAEVQVAVEVERRLVLLLLAIWLYYRPARAAAEGGWLYGLPAKVGALGGEVGQLAAVVELVATQGAVRQHAHELPVLHRGAAVAGEEGQLQA
mmetsp:Transcript_25391/g.56230  ORF Transcript_25391/g.56230 Transcript_25391/m.56230 type:complete len:215 (-) Transcript_25391:4386-5030(-)